MSTTVEVNGHVEARYVEGSGWQAPQFIQDPFLRIHGLSPSLNYGQQAFEGMKAYRTEKDEIFLFRVEEHGARLNRSSEFISIPHFPIRLFRRCVHLAVWQNAEFVPLADSGAALYIRPVIIGLSASMVPSPPKEYLFYIYVQPLAPYLGTSALSAVVLEDYDRTAPKGTGSVKVGGNYAPVMRWSCEGKKQGYDILLHLDSVTHDTVDEFSTAAFIGIVRGNDNTTMVISQSRNIIASITADSAAGVAESLGWNVQRRVIQYNELPSFSEVIAAGTAAGLVPVRSITHRSQGNHFDYSLGDASETGSCCTVLSGMLTAIVRGKTYDKWGWCEVVTDASC